MTFWILYSLLWERAREMSFQLVHLYNIALKWSSMNTFMKKILFNFFLRSNWNWKGLCLQIFKMFPQNQITASQRCGGIKNLHFSKTCCFNKVQNQNEASNLMRWLFPVFVLNVPLILSWSSFMSLVAVWQVWQDLCENCCAHWRKQNWKLSHTAENFVCSM